MRIQCHVSKLLLIVTAATAAACQIEETSVPVAVQPGEALAGIGVSPKSAILAVGQQQTLTVAPRSLNGGATLAVDSVKYLFVNPADTALVQIAANGTVTALAASSEIDVNVVGYLGGVSRCTRVVLQVAPTAISGMTLSMQPSPGELTVLAAGNSKNITPMISDPGSGETIYASVQYESSDSSAIAVFDPAIYAPPTFSICNRSTSPASSPTQIVALTPERSAWIYGSVSVFGNVLRDSVQYTASYPLAALLSTRVQQVAIVNDFANQTVTLAPGASVTFRNGTAATDSVAMTYTFSDPTAAGPTVPPTSVGGTSGDVSVLNAGQSARRRFANLGTVVWTAKAVSGPTTWVGQTLSGTIVIK